MCRNQVCDVKSEPFYLAFTLVKTSVVRIPEIFKYSISIPSPITHNPTGTNSSMWNQARPRTKCKGG
jgi:hypothetical protein